MTKVNVYHLREAMHNLLNAREQNSFIEGLNEFHINRDVHSLAYKLKQVLDTPAKRQLAAMIRQVIPGKDVRIFDQLMSSYDSYSLPNRKMELQEIAGGIERAASSMSVPATLQRSFLSQSRPANLLHADDLDLPAWASPDSAPSTRKVHLDKADGDYGFSIRGGAEHGIGVYVSYVDVNSVAERKGIVPGDMIVSANGTSFHKIPHAQAVKIIKSSARLDLEVRNVGRVPGSFESHQTYTWVDPSGRTVSPPPEVDRIGRYQPGNEQRKSNLMLLKHSDERKVNVAVSGKSVLGLKIRGGNEFGLGIYVTGLDAGSPAQNAGLKVGDQILDVNGQSFLDISHNDAVKALKTSKHLMITTKDVGKLPYARTTYDQTQWIHSLRMPRKANPPRRKELPEYHSEPVFKRGAGSQLMHASMVTPTSRSMLEEYARNLLNDQEQSTFLYYLHQYQDGHVTVASLLLALTQLLNTDAKFSLTNEVRSIILARDLKDYDALLSDARSARLQHKAETGSHYSFKSAASSSSSHSSKDSLGDSDLFTPKAEIKLQRDPLQEAIDSINDSRETVQAEDTPPASRRQGKSERVSSRSLDRNSSRPHDRKSNQSQDRMSNRMSNKNQHSMSSRREAEDLQASVTVADVHRLPESPTHEAWRTPSDDSGVDTNGDISLSYRQSKERKKRVRMSAQEPVIINEVLGGYAVYDESSSSMEDNAGQVSRGHPAQVSYKQGSPDNPHKSSWQNRGHQAVDRDRSDVHTNRHKSSSHNDSHHASDRSDDQASWHKPHQTTTSDHMDVIQNNLQDSRHKPKRMSSKSGSIHSTDPRQALMRDIRSGKLNLRHVTTDEVKTHEVSPHEMPYRGHNEKSRAPAISPHHRKASSLSHATSKHNTPKPVLSKSAGGEGIPQGRIEVVTIYKTKPTLGLAIEGGANTRQPLPRVSNIQPGGSAYESGGLNVGHIILEVNGRSLRQMEHNACARTIAEAFKNRSLAQLELLVVDPSS